MIILLEFIKGQNEALPRARALIADVRALVSLKGLIYLGNQPWQAIPHPDETLNDKTCAFYVQPCHGLDR